MQLIKADQDRRVDLAGVPHPVPRPVDIDQTCTHFKALKTLRVYRFAPPAVIDGHAEEDEVLLVVLSGTVELVIRGENWPDSGASFRLTSANDRAAVTCAAYLPPQAEYRLTPLDSAEVAYARATPSGQRAPRILTSAPRVAEGGAVVLWDEQTTAERLRCRLVQVDAALRATAVTLLRDAEVQSEALIYLRTTPARGAAAIATEGSPPLSLDTGDTIAVGPGSHANLHLSVGASVVGFIVTAV